VGWNIFYWKRLLVRNAGQNRLNLLSGFTDPLYIIGHYKK
jgi:hypothetical protein